MKLGRKRGGLILGVICAALAAAPSLGQNAPAESSPPLRFRRVYVPTDRLKDWPIERQHVPVDPTRFEEMVKALDEPEIEAAPAATLKRADYSCSLQGEMLQGTLHWETPAGDGPQRIVLTPCTLALGDYRWVDREERPILATSADGALALVADRGGVFQATWTATGRRTSNGGLEFTLTLPRSPLQRLALELPAGWSVVSNPSSVVQQHVDAKQVGHWVVELGGQRRVALQLQRADAMAQSRRLPLVRTAAAYEFSGRGVNVAAIWRLETYDQPLQDISVVLDPGLQLIGAQYGDAPLTWTRIGDDANSATRVMLRLPQPVTGVARPLRIDAVASAVLDRTDALPRIHPTGLAWQEGTLTVVVPEPFVLEQFEPIHCRQIRTSPLPEPLSGESLELQCFASDATVRWRIGRTTARLRINQGTNITLAEGATAAQEVIEARVDSGERFSLTAEIAPAWLVEAVESTPPGRVADWTIESNEKGRPALVIRFQEPITPARPVRLLVSGHGSVHDPQQRIASSQLRFLTLPGAMLDSRLLAISSLPPWSVRLEDDYQLSRLSRDALTAVERDLLPSAAAAQIIRLDDKSPSWRMRLVPRRAPMSAVLDVRVVVDSAALDENYEIACQPGQDAIEHVLVHFTHARVESPQWRFDRGMSGQFRTRRLTAEQQTALELPVAGETWEIAFIEPQHNAFRIRASRHSAFSQESPVSLVVIPDATEQRGTVTLGGEADIPWTIENRRLTAAPPRDASDSTSRQSFDYDPRKLLNIDTGPVLSVRRASGSSPTSAALIEQEHVDYLVNPTGTTRGRFRWTILNQGRKQLVIRGRDKGVEIAEVLVEGQRLNLDVGTPDVVAPLPTKSRRVEVIVLTRQQYAAARWFARTPLPAIEVDIPILSSQAIAWVAAGYQPLSDAGREDGILQSVRRRWFGGLSRNDNQPPFDFTSPLAWAELATGQQWESRRISEVALAQLGAIRAPIEGKTANDQVLSLWARALADEGISVWASDQSPLSLLDLDAESGATKSHGWQSSTDHGKRRLAKSGLALVVAGDSVAMIPLTDAQRLDAVLTAIDGPYVWAPRDSRWSKRQTVQALLSVQAGLSPVSASTSSGPEAMPRKLRSAATVLPGWRPVYLGNSSETESLAIVNQAFLSAMSLTTFLISVALLGTLMRWRAQWHGPLSLMILAMALLSPNAWTPLASALSLAAMTSLVVRLLPLFWRRSRNGPQPQWAHNPLSRPALGRMTLLFAWSLATQAAYGEEPNPVAGKAADVPRVFIPVDDSGKPTGGRYQVPVDLYKEFTRRLQEKASAGGDWHVSGAAYQMVFAQDADSASLDLVECRVTYRLHVAKPGTEWRLPLSFASTADEPLRGLLDGQPIELTWDDTHRRVCGVSSNAGDMQLELNLDPEVVEENDHQQLVLSVPPVADASLEITLPSDSPPVELPTALGEQTWSDNGRRLTVRLGPTPTIVARWPTLGARMANSLVDIDELQWIRIRPGSVSAELTLRVNVAAGVCRSIPLLVDPRWRLLPVKGDASVARVETMPGDPLHPETPREVLLRLKNATTDPFTLRLSFLQIGASGIGIVRLPTLEPMGARTTRRWMALTVDSALDHEFTAADAVVVPPDALAEQWKLVGATPQLVLDRAASAGPISITTRPKEPQIEATQQLSLVAHRMGLSVRYEAQLNTAGAATFQHRLQAPEDLVVEDVSVLEDGAQRVAHWSQLPGGNIVVFLNEPSIGEHSLSLRGHLPLPTGGQALLPWIAMEDSRVSTSTSRLDRDSSVIVDVDPAADVEAIVVEPSAASPTRCVGAWRTAGERPAVKLKIRPNEPRTNILQITTLRSDAKNWSADIELIASVEDGVLDRLQFEAPRSWSGPLVISPPMEYEMIEIPRQDHQLLVLTPREAVTDALRIKISGPLSVGVGQMISWAGATPLVNGTVERYQRFPRAWNGQAIAWDVEGLRPSPLPDLIGAFADSAAMETFRVSSGKVSAQMRKVHDRNAGAQVRLVEIRMAPAVGDSVIGRATIAVEPGGLDNLSFSVPKACELLQVQVDGHVQTPTWRDDRCLVPLWSDLPQRVDLTFTCQLAAGDRRQPRLFVPAVEDVPVLQTVWIQQEPIRATSAVTLATEKGRLDEYQLALIHWQSLMAIYEKAWDLSTLQQTEKWQLWSARWWPIVQSARAEAELRRSQWQSLGKVLDDNQWNALTRMRARIEAARQEAGASQTAVDQETTIDLQLAGSAAIFLFPGRVAELSVPQVEPGKGVTILRASAAVGLAVLAIVMLWFGPRLSPAADLLPRWANPLGVVVGIAWWLWLAPSWLGLVLAGLSVMLAVRSGLRTTNESHSTITRLPVGAA